MPPLDLGTAVYVLLMSWPTNKTRNHWGMRPHCVNVNDASMTPQWRLLAINAQAGESGMSDGPACRFLTVALLYYCNLRAPLSHRCRTNGAPPHQNLSKKPQVHLNTANARAAIQRISAYHLLPSANLNHSWVIQSGVLSHLSTSREMRCIEM